MRHLKQKGFVYVFIMLLCGVFASCGTSKVAISKGVYSKNVPITIVKSGDDPVGAVEELQFLLKENGYKVMSYSAVKQKFNINTDYDSSSTSISMYHSTTFNSCYIMELNYTHEWDLGGYYFWKCFVTISDLKSGELIMSSRFNGYKRVSTVLENLVDEITKVIE